MSKTKDKKKIGPKVQIEKLSSGYLVTVIGEGTTVGYTLMGTPVEAGGVDRLALVTLADVVETLKEVFQESTTSLGLDDMPKKKKEK